MGYALIAERIWTGDIQIADIEELENLAASEIIFGGLTRRKSSLLNRDHPIRGEDHEDLLGESQGFPPS